VNKLLSSHYALISVTYTFVDVPWNTAIFSPGETLNISISPDGKRADVALAVGEEPKTKWQLASPTTLMYSVCEPNAAEAVEEWWGLRFYVEPGLKA